MYVSSNRQQIGPVEWNKIQNTRNKTKIKQTTEKWILLLLYVLCVCPVDFLFLYRFDSFYFIYHFVSALLLFINLYYKILFVINYIGARTTKPITKRRAQDERNGNLCVLNVRHSRESSESSIWRGNKFIFEETRLWRPKKKTTANNIKSNQMGWYIT